MILYPDEPLMTWLMIAVGGALGALSRYGVSLWLNSEATAFPVATLLVNLSGCFLLAILSTWAARGSVDPAVYAGLTVGFLGAFTTFSTFALEGDLLVTQGAHFSAIAYLVGSIVLGYLMILAGQVLTVRWLG